MGTTRTFNEMLNEYLSVVLLREELMKRDYVLSKVTQDNSWKGGTIPVPFMGGESSSVSFGSLTDESDVSESTAVRGELSTMPEIWGTLSFNSRDLKEHNGKIPESTFLKILPTEIDRFLTHIKMVTSVNMLDGPHFATATVDGTAGGVLEVDRVDRFKLGQKVCLIDGNTASANFYVIAIDVNGGTLKNGAVTLSATRGGLASADVANYTVAQSAKVYHPGAATGSFTSLKSQLLSAANGGSANLFGKSKVLYPYLQAINHDGSGIGESTILKKIFDFYTRQMILGKAAAAPDIVMSFKNFGACMKLLETQKGAFNVDPGSRKTSQYGFDTIEVGSVTGQRMKLVAVQECPNSEIFMLDWSTVKLFSNGFFKWETTPDGIRYYTKRATTGWKFLTDVSFFGDIAVLAPANNGIIHSIPNF